MRIQSPRHAKGQPSTLSPSPLRSVWRQRAADPRFLKTRGTPCTPTMTVSIKKNVSTFCSYTEDSTFALRLPAQQFDCCLRKIMEVRYRTKGGRGTDRSSFLSWKSAFARNEQVRLLGSIKNLLEMYVRPNMTGSIRIKGVSKFVAQPHKCDHQVSNQPREETFVKTETRHEDREESERRFWSHIEPPRAIIELILV